MNAAVEARMKPTKLVILISLKDLYTSVLRAIAGLVGSLSSIPSPLPSYCLSALLIGLPKIQEIIANTRNKTASTHQKMNTYEFYHNY